MVFYRKYRPQKISELDLSVVRDRLSAILKSGDFPHAFLFAGPKGLGKTSSARILARAINCENRNKELGVKNKEAKKHNSSLLIHNSGEIEPCNECEACLTITEGSNLDVLEIDAASNRGIDEIRDLREKIKFAPVSLSKKVYIIDEVHMLTTEAFNALLKTLEEPPAHAVFILCTTEPWKLPDTIISRTFFVQFGKPNKEELSRSIDRILKGEGLELEKDLFDDIYLLSDGSFRDATKVIEELALSAKDKKITKEIFQSAFKSSSVDGEIAKLLVSLSEKNVKEALSIVGKFSEEGVDFKIVIEKLVDQLRKLLLKKSGLPATLSLVSQAGFDEEIEDVKGLDVISISTLIEYFSKSYKDLKFAVIQSLPLELAVIKWCLFSNLTEEKTEVVKDTEEKKAEKPKEDLLLSHQIVSKDAFPQVSVKDENFFAALIEEVKKDNHSIAAILRGCKLVNVKTEDFTITTSYKFHKDKLNDNKIKAIIEKRAAEILGKNVKLNVDTKQDKK